MAYCKECGAEIGESKFCPECGAAQEAAAPVKAEPEKKKGPSTSGLLFLAIVAVCLIAAIIALSSNGDSGPAPTRRPTTVRLEYKITGTARSVDLTYNNDQGNTEQLDNIKVP